MEFITSGRVTSHVATVCGLFFNVVSGNCLKLVAFLGCLLVLSHNEIYECCDPFASSSRSCYLHIPIFLSSILSLWSTLPVVFMLIPSFLCQIPELHGIDRIILMRALKLLEHKGKLAIFKGTSADDEGVKFSV